MLRKRSWVKEKMTQFWWWFQRIFWSSKSQVQGPLIIKNPAMLCNLVLLQYTQYYTNHNRSELSETFPLIVWCDFFQQNLFNMNMRFCYIKVNSFFVASDSTFITLNVRGSNVRFTITYFSCFCAAVFFKINGINVDHLQIKHKNWILHLLPFIIA